MNKFKMKVTAVIGVILLIGIYYYVTLPAINIHASEFWMYLVVLVILAAVVFIRKKNLNRYDWKESKGLKVILGILAVLVIAYVAGISFVFSNCECEEVSGTFDGEEWRIYERYRRIIF